MTAYGMFREEIEETLSRSNPPLCLIFADFSIAEKAGTTERAFGNFGSTGGHLFE